jgi:hypothetical protein
MPVRHHVVAILLFWAATAGWFFYRDLWPRIRPGEPPPYTIDLADEARSELRPLKIHWGVYRVDPKKDRVRIGQVRTWVAYHRKDDTFELHSESQKLELGRPGLFSGQVTDLSSLYRVTRRGELREIRSASAFAVHFPFFSVQGRMLLQGTVENEQFVPHGFVMFGSGWRTESLGLEPVPLSGGGSILNPLHPVNRIDGLRRGQHWRMPRVDPLEQSLRKLPVVQAILGEPPGVQILRAEVLNEAQTLPWGLDEVPCLVIEYRGEQENLTAHTWVREADGLVLRQDATIGGDQLILERE